jgi:hypothetical protein
MRVGVQLGLKAGASPAIGFLILSLNAHQDVFEYELLGAPVGELGALLGRSPEPQAVPPFTPLRRAARVLWPRCARPRLRATYPPSTLDGGRPRTRRANSLRQTAVKGRYAD